MEPIIDIQPNSLEALFNQKPNKTFVLFPNDTITIKSRSFCIVEVKYLQNDDILDSSFNSKNNNQ